MKSPILITGCSRSGASLIAGAIHICGGFGGGINQKNNFENQGISLIDKQYLTSIGCDPRGQDPLPTSSNLSIPSNWKQEIEQVILKEGYTGGPWFYKGGRTCLIWPVWHYAFPNAKWVIVRRRNVDIATSCLKTSFMDAFSTYEDWITWINCYENFFVEMIKAGLNVKMIWPERIVKGNYEQLYELVEWLGLTWKSEQVMDFIEPKLWKTRKKQGIKL